MKTVGSLYIVIKKKYHKKYKSTKPAVILHILSNENLLFFSELIFKHYFTIIRRKNIGYQA